MVGHAILIGIDVGRLYGVDVSVSIRVGRIEKVIARGIVQFSAVVAAVTVGVRVQRIGADQGLQCIGYPISIGVGPVGWPTNACVTRLTR